MSWDASTLQIHHDGNYLTLSESKNENFQSIEKQTEKGNIHAHFFSQAF